MKNLYNEFFRNSIKIGDTVCIKKEDSSEKYLRGQITKILPNDIEGLKVEVILDENAEKFQVKEVGFVQYVITGNEVVYGTLK